MVSASDFEGALPPVIGPQVERQIRGGGDLPAADDKGMAPSQTGNEPTDFSDGSGSLDIPAG